MQPPCQEGNLPSRSTPGAPPLATPKRTQPQWGGWPKASHHNPPKLAAKFCSAGWKKDLEHVLRVYYKFNAAARFREVDWVQLRDTFFPYFLQYKEEVLDIKENNPIDFMPYIEDHFWRATSLCLNGLQDFTAWIKQGSYYHGMVAQQDHLDKCPHLAGAPIPMWPQLTPSESHQES